MSCSDQCSPQYHNDDGYTVLVKSSEEVKKDLFVPVMRETKFLFKPENNIKLQKWPCAAVANISETSITSVCINGTLEPNAAVHGNKVRLNDAIIRSYCCVG